MFCFFFVAKIVVISLIIYTENLATAIFKKQFSRPSFDVKSMKPVTETAIFHKSCSPAVATLYLLRSPAETAENSCGNNC